MVIAGPEPKRVKRGKGGTGKEEPCQIMLNDTCL